MKVSWYNVDINRFFDSAKSIKLRGSEVLDRVSLIDKEFDTALDLTESQGSQFVVPFRTKKLLKPLGKLANVLIKEGDQEGAFNMLRRYWNSSGTEPVMTFDTLQVDDETKKPVDVLVRTKEGRNDVGFSKLVEDLDHDLFTRTYQRVYLGGQAEHVELQFLSTSNRKPNAVGDLFDPGLFVKLNGRVEAAPGVHWLACTNGNTRQMRIMNRDGLQLLNDEKLLTESVHLMDWLISKKNEPVRSVRELSVAFSSKYGKTFLSKFWKVWSEKIELKTLTWFDVLDHMTRTVRDTLSGHRYDVMAVSDRMDSQAFCPTCSSPACSEALVTK